MPNSFLINSYLAFSIFLFCMTTLLQLGVYFIFPLLGFTVDKLGSYESTFYMAGGVLVVASLTPCVFYWRTVKQMDKNC